MKTRKKNVLLLSEYKEPKEEQDKLLLKWEQDQYKLGATRKELGAGDR